MGRGKKTYRVYMGKPEGKRQLGRSSLRWEGNVKIDLLKIR
jgi:hypothetical protein